MNNKKHHPFVRVLNSSRTVLIFTIISSRLTVTRIITVASRRSTIIVNWYQCDLTVRVSSFQQMFSFKLMMMRGWRDDYNIGFVEMFSTQVAHLKLFVFSSLEWTRIFSRVSIFSRSNRSKIVSIKSVKKYRHLKRNFMLFFVLILTNDFRKIKTKENSIKRAESDRFDDSLTQ